MASFLKKENFGQIIDLVNNRGGLGKVILNESCKKRNDSGIRTIRESQKLLNKMNQK